MDNEFKIAVCIVDDNPIDTKLHKHIVENSGYEVQVTEHYDWKSFVVFLSCNPDTDLIFLDINMGDQVHFLEKVKEIKRIAGLAYILILTSSNNIEDFLNASLAQCNGFIAKGFNVPYYIKAHLDIIYTKIALRNAYIEKIKHG